MDKKLYEEKVYRQKEAAIARMKELSNNMLIEEEACRITKPCSQYRPFEVSFGSERLKEIHEFFLSLDKSELENRPYLNDPLLLVCQKFLDWKVEVGSDRLWHEFFVRYNNKDNYEGSTYLIKKAWEEIKKEQEFIEISRQNYKTYLNEILSANPRLPSTDPLHWCALCDGFNEFEALQEFGYPLPFDSIFGVYAPNSFYGKPLDKNKFFKEK